MTYLNNNKPGVHPQVWQWNRMLPASTSATSCFAAGDKVGERYMYYLNAGAFYRVDINSDLPAQQLASPPTTSTTGSVMRYSSYAGYRGNCLGATSTTIDIPGLELQTFKGKTIRITSGLGEGQDRVITDITEAKLFDQGMVTAADANSLTDTTKRWEINQYIGYQVRLVYGTGQSQVHKILYNDTNKLYFYDINYQQLECWNNTPFSASAPYALPVSTAGSQTNYYIEKSTATIDTAWDITPDATSSFVIMTGGIFFLTAGTTTTRSILQYYDVASGTWTSKTNLNSHLLAAIGTDFTIDRTGEVGGSFLSGSATAGGNKILTTGTVLDVHRWANYQLRITGGTGLGQKRRIETNTTSTFYVNRPWTTNPDSTSKFEVWGNNQRMYFMGNAQAAVLKYDVEIDAWFQSNMVDYGQARNMAVAYAGQEAQAITSATSNAAGITVLNPTPTAGGTGYAVGDLFNITTGGTVGKGRVEAISAGGVVTAVSLYSAGINYTTGAGKATTIISGAGNNGLTVNITTVGRVGRVTTVTNTNFYKGDTVVISGINEAGWNGSYSILAIDGLTTFDIITTATVTATATASQSTTVIVDATKNWAINEHVGKIVQLMIAGTTSTAQKRRIVSNTANSLTVATISAGTNGTSRYVITEPSAFGRAKQWKVAEKENVGFATSGSPTTLVDSTKNWFVNQWAGYRVRVISGTGEGTESAITANTVDTLTLTTPGFTADATTRYIIMDTFGIATAGAATTLTDTTKNWTVNMWAGKRIYITAGTGQDQEFTILSNTATAITITAAAWTTTPDTTSCYTILDNPVRSTGVQANWIYGNANTDTKGKYLWCPRGGASNMWDRYDITRETWDISPMISPQAVTLTTGSMYAYDGANRIYFTKDATGWVYYLDVDTGIVDGFGMLPYAMSTAIIGNRMEIMQPVEGLKKLIIARHSATELWNTIPFV